MNLFGFFIILYSFKKAFFEYILYSKLSLFLGREDVVKVLLQKSQKHCILKKREFKILLISTDNRHTEH